MTTGYFIELRFESMKSKQYRKDCWEKMLREAMLITLRYSEQVVVSSHKATFPFVGVSIVHIFALVRACIGLIFVCTRGLVLRLRTGAPLFI